MAQVAFELDQMDDPVLADGMPSFNGGQVSNERANLLQPNESALLVNCDINKFGKIRTRRGTTQLGAGTMGTGTIVQGLSNFFTATYNYLVGAIGGKIYKFVSGSWTQIALGGVSDNDNINVLRVATVTTARGYGIGETWIEVTMTGMVHVGDKFVFANDVFRGQLFEYTVIGGADDGTNTLAVKIADPGLVNVVYAGNTVTFKLKGKINNGGGYAAGTTVIAVDGFNGLTKVNTGEKVVIEQENVLHTITAHTETAGVTTSITISPGLQGAYAGNTTAPIQFAVGDDNIYWCDGVGNIFSWDGVHTQNLSDGNLYSQWSTTTAATAKPPTGVGVLVWFQSRLIAAGITGQPDAVFFSDFLDATVWDSNFQMVRIGGGESDPIIALVPWTDLNLVVLKKHSVYVVNCDPGQNPNPDDPTQLVASFAIKLVNKHIGCVAQRTAVQVGGGSALPGGDVFFLSDLGVRSLRRTLASETQQEIGEPLSFPVQDIIDRINLPYIANPCDTIHNNRYLLAIPVDAATQPNYVLVYNTITGSWTGYWTGWTATSFAVQTPSGQHPSLCFGQSDGTVQQWLDDVADTAEVTATYQDHGTAIPTQIKTRAFTAEI